MRCPGRLESLPCRANGRSEWNLPKTLQAAPAKLPRVLLQLRQLPRTRSWRSAAEPAICGGYERLYALHGARMKNVARNLLGNPIDAEDAVQETFLKVQRSIAGFRGQSSFVTWTYRILINTCYDARRSRMRKKEVANDDSEDSPRPEPRAPGAHPSLRMALERALAGLTKHQRDVFLVVRSGRLPSCGDCRNAGDYGDGFEEHTFSGEEKPSPGP